MSLPDLDSTESGVRAGRKFGYATIGEWVPLCTELSDRAVRIYCLLRAHGASSSEAARAWPAQKTLAEMLGIKKTDGIAKAIQELVDVGAVQVEMTKTTTGRRNVYIVNEPPPEGYNRGPNDNVDFYKIREERRRSEGVTPQQGVTPQKGVMGHPPTRGDGSPPSRGSEPTQVEPPEAEPETTADAAAAGPPSGEPLPSEKLDHLESVVDLEPELATKPTTRTRGERGTPVLSGDPVDYPEPTATDRTLYGDRLDAVCGHCLAPAGRLCVRASTKKPFPVAACAHDARPSKSGSESGIGLANVTPVVHNRRVKVNAR